MDTLLLYERWLKNALGDPDLHMELSRPNSRTDEKDIYDRFYRNLEFGTGGLRRKQYGSSGLAKPEGFGGN